ncbi:MAG: hypothetical protein MJ155_00895 [Candidatus Saccharibacteria bacterium]|nr:hypothetical protein [Candidatus Saccharibacteria bacterium]
MNPTDDAAAPKAQENETPTITAPEGIDLDAINEAIAESEKAPNQQNSFDVNDISLENTPTTDAELQSQLSQDPNMSLAGGSSEGGAATETPLSAPEVAAQQEPAAPVAGFVDGDLMDDPEAPAPEATPDYAAREADPVESFDENAPVPASAPAEDASAPAATTPEGGDAPATDAKKDAKKPKAPKKNIDFDAILHNNVAIAGIVAGGIVLVLVIILVVALN